MLHVFVVCIAPIARWIVVSDRPKGLSAFDNDGGYRTGYLQDPPIAPLLVKIKDSPYLWRDAHFLLHLDFNPNFNPIDFSLIDRALLEKRHVAPARLVA
jgi:hypothetical protein